MSQLQTIEIWWYVTLHAFHRRAGPKQKGVSTKAVLLLAFSTETETSVLQHVQVICNLQHAVDFVIMHVACEFAMLNGHQSNVLRRTRTAQL